MPNALPNGRDVGQLLGVVPTAPAPPSSPGPLARVFGAWDRRAFRGAALATTLLAALAVLVTAATDEGGVRWGERTARAAAFVPIAAGLAVALALRGPERRGELVALQALGAAPRRLVRPFVAGAMAVAGLAAIALWLGHLDAEPFYPEVVVVTPPRPDGNDFVFEAHRVRVNADGSLLRLGATDGEAAPSRTVDRLGRRRTAAGALGLLSLAFAVVGARAGATRRIEARTLGVGAAFLGATVAAQTVAFHIVATQRASLLWALAVPCIALATVLQRWPARRPMRRGEPAK